MADEDEIDVLGDFSLDNLLSKNETGISSCYDNTVLNTQNSELLSCDYSLNSQWLLENPTSNTDCWYTGSGNEFNTEDGNSTNTSLGFDEVICTENKTTDESGWTEEEKSLLIKGLEIFGKNSTNLSQFIGSKSPSQVKYYLKHFYVKNTFSNIYNTVEINKQSSNNTTNTELPSVFKMSDIIEDAQIPASIEEVIAAVSTATTTVQNVYKNNSLNNKRKLSYSTKKSKSTQRSLLMSTLTKKREIRSVVNRRKRSKSERMEKNYTLKEPDQKSKAKAKANAKANVNVKTPESSVAPVLPVLPISSGEQVIKIKKETDTESDEDIEIDIDEFSPTIDSTKPIESKEHQYSNTIKEELIQNPAIEANNKNENKTETEKLIVDKDKEKENEDELLKRRLKSVSDAVLAQLMSNEIPTKVCELATNEITDLEKCVHVEFFEGRPTKTPSRYLKIRNHIIDQWFENKPQYCTKTSVRQGLKNCGDVNCIGRVHHFLEQIGAINFGCEQIRYIRPLMKMLSMPSSQAKEKQTVQQPQKIDLIRPRMKKKYNNDGEGGYTMMHDENGHIIDTTVINEEKQSKPRNHRRQNIKLLYCKGFTNENPAPFSVVLHLNALLLIDMHSHSALIEVMGLLGGFFDHENKVLHITQYKPCVGVDHSNTHCDMCPVSQSEASESLHAEGIEVIGWFHSHPTFYPNPSLQDIDTQLNMQLYLSNKYKPFIGVILSPFRERDREAPGALVSEYRCLIVDNNEPYKFQATLSTIDFHVDLFLRNATEIFNAKHNIPKEFLIDFNKKYFQDYSITYLQKLLASVKLHLARCTQLNKMTCDAIISGITDICLNASNTQL